MPGCHGNQATKTIINSENQYTNLLAQYHLDGAGFVIDKSWTQYQLLTMAELNSCSRASVRFCTVRNPVFTVALTKSCMIELFMSRENDDVTSCLTQISNQMLPTAIYLFDINWVVIAREDLTFALVCNSRVHGEKKTKSPVFIIQVKDVCTASNKHFALSSPYIMGKPISTNARLILQAANFSKSVVWKPFEEKFSNYTTLKLPEHLSAVKDMTLSELVLEMESTYNVYVDSNASAHKARPIWSFVSPSLTMVVAIFLISYCCCCKGKKCPTCLCVTYLPNCMRKKFQKKRQQNGSMEKIELREMKSGGKNPPTVSPLEDPTSDSDRPKLYPILFGKNTETTLY